jgi:hypothetical protein
LAKNPADRPQTARQFAALLEAPPTAPAKAAESPEPFNWSMLDHSPPPATTLPSMPAGSPSYPRQATSNEGAIRSTSLNFDHPPKPHTSIVRIVVATVFAVIAIVAYGIWVGTGTYLKIDSIGEVVEYQGRAGWPFPGFPMVKNRSGINSAWLQDSDRSRLADGENEDGGDYSSSTDMPPSFRNDGSLKSRLWARMSARGQARVWAGEGWSRFQSNTTADKDQITKDAEEAFQAALKLDQHCASALVGMGNVHLRKNEVPDAVSAYRMALASDAGNRDAKDGLAEAERLKGLLEHPVDFERIEFDTSSDFNNVRDDLPPTKEVFFRAVFRNRLVGSQISAVRDIRFTVSNAKPGVRWNATVASSGNSGSEVYATTSFVYTQLPHNETVVVRAYLDGNHLGTARVHID